MYQQIQSFSIEKINRRRENISRNEEMMVMMIIAIIIMVMPMIIRW